MDNANGSFDYPDADKPLAYGYVTNDVLAKMQGVNPFHNGFKWTKHKIYFERGHYWLGNYKATSVLISTF